ncbi:MAG: divalent-cation tolerance protein CutA [Blastocatellia bacterium]
MSDALVVLTTVEKQEDGARLARLLIERKLAACAQVLAPMISIYRWRGEIEQSGEVLLLIKTTRAAYQELEDAIKQNHPYETPEIIALPVETGSNDYLSWLDSSIKFDA